MQMYCETWNIYVFESLARSRIQVTIFSVGTFGGLAPPHTKKLATLLPIPTEVITFFRLENEDPFQVRIFFLAGEGGGAC